MSEAYPEKILEIINAAVLELGSMENTEFVSIPDSSQLVENDVSMIGVMGEYLSGFFGVLTEEPFLRNTIPIKVENEGDLKDWHCEITNFLLGIVKNKFVLLNVDFNVSVPQLVDRQDFLQFEQNVGQVAQLHFNSKKGAFCVLFCFTIAPDFKLAEQDNENKVLGSHGTGVVF